MWVWVWVWVWVRALAFMRALSMGVTSAKSCEKAGDALKISALVGVGVRGGGRGVGV